MLDPEAPARHALYVRPLEDRIADVCPTCGQHMILNVVARLEWINSGGEIRCVNCNTTKTRTV